MYYEALQKAAADRGVKMADIAKALDIDKSNVTRWNQTKVPVDRLVVLKEKFGIDPEKVRPDIMAIARRLVAD